MSAGGELEVLAVAHARDLDAKRACGPALLGAQLVLALGVDYAGDGPLHAATARLRAVQCGYSVVWNAGGGDAVAVDRHGRVLGRAQASEALVAHVPVDGAATPAARLGEGAAPLAALAWLLARAALASMRRPKQHAS